MKYVLIVLFLLIAGCVEGDVESRGLESAGARQIEDELKSVALSSEDLGFVGWVQSAENKTPEVFERRFIRVEDTFGSFSRLVNRVHFYPDVESAGVDYGSVARRLGEEHEVSGPDVGEEAVLWVHGGQGYLLFIRGNLIVEFEYTTPGEAEGDFLVEQARKVDSRIFDYD